LQIVKLKVLAQFCVRYKVHTKLFLLSQLYIIAIVLLLSLLLSGCQPSSKNVDMNTIENTSEESTTLFFEEYEIGILAPYLYVYKEPSYESEIVGAVYQQDTCLVIDEAVAESVYWIKLKKPEGWITLNYNYCEEIYSNHEDNYYSEQYEDSTKDGFEPYQIKIQRNSLTVWDVPGYTLGEAWYEITDRRTVTIVEETVIYENGKERTWGRLETGGWISLTAASYVEEPTTIEKDNNTSATQTETTTKKDTTQKPTTTQKTETTTITTLDGNLVWYGIFGATYIYGCGNEHTVIENGVTFHWYDRYELRNKDNTIVYSYIILNSFSIKYEESVVPSWDNNFWSVDFDVVVSDGDTASLYWQLQDKDGYPLDEAQMLINKSNTDGGSVDTSIQGKSRGKGKVYGHQIDRATKYAELCPSL